MSLPPMTYILEKLLQVQQSKYLQPPRPPMFRVSSLPFCPILHLYEQQEFTGEPDQIAFRAGHYFRIGHAVHDNYQFTSLNALKTEVIGDYSCDRILKTEVIGDTVVTHKCNRLIKFCTPEEALKHPCPHRFNSCAEFMRYSELEFKYRGISGHCDWVLKQPDGFASKVNKKTGKRVKVPLFKWHVADFKTTGESLFVNPQYCIKSGNYPSKKYIEQIETYCAFIEHFHKVKISTYTIAYVSRDRPLHDNKSKSLYTFTYAWTAERRKNRRKTLATYFKQYEQVQEFLKTLSKGIFSELVDGRPCHTEKEYQSKMKSHFFGKEECPLKDICLKCSAKETKKKLWSKLNPLIKKRSKKC